jgi:hypothetical protein
MGEMTDAARRAARISVARDVGPLSNRVKIKGLPETLLTLRALLQRHHSDLFGKNSQQGADLDHHVSVMRQQMLEGRITPEQARRRQSELIDIHLGYWSSIYVLYAHVGALAIEVAENLSPPLSSAPLTSFLLCRNNRLTDADFEAAIQFAVSLRARYAGTESADVPQVAPWDRKVVTANQEMFSRSEIWVSFPEIGESEKRRNRIKNKLTEFAKKNAERVKVIRPVAGGRSEEHFPADFVRSIVREDLQKHAS